MVDRPTTVVQRRRLRAQLRGARQRAKLTQEQVAEAMDWSPSKIIRIEAGSVGVSTNDMRALIGLYQIDDPAQTAELLELAKEARERSATYKGVPTKLLNYIEYEAAASTIRGFQPLLVPGLLQTDEYARAVLQQFMDAPARAQVDAMVKIRMKRKEVLARSNPPQLFLVIDEAVLRRPVGGETVMQRQIHHLIEVAARPNVTLEVVPFSAGVHPGLQGPFVILEFPDAAAEDVLYLENSRGDLIIRDELDEIATHEERFDLLTKLSLGPRDSVTFLSRAAADMT
jgi:transcriptional regulator with XRE-family HTH domain